MSSAPGPAPDRQVTIPESVGFAAVRKEVVALAWPTAVAAFAGYAYFLGFVSERARYNALGLEGLVRPAINQEYIYSGAGSVAAIAAPVFTFIVAYFLLCKVGRAIVARAHGADSWAARARGLLGRPVVWWTVLIVVVVGATLLAGYCADLVKQSDGMLLKPRNEIGNTWADIVLDHEDEDSFALYWFLLCGGFSLFMALSAWLVKSPGFETASKRRLFASWAALQALALVAIYSMIFGVASTVTRYPVVIFPTMEQYGKHTVALLLDSDDKQFAFLLLRTEESAGPNKMILYVPRSEVKWMSVIREAHLHIYAHYDEIIKDLDKQRGIRHTDSTSPEPAATPKAGVNELAPK